MTVERLAVQTVTPYEVDAEDLDGRQFEQVTAVATIALDPDLAANTRIVDLEWARRDSDGLVRLDTDVVLIRPRITAPVSASGPLLFVVANRGLVTSLPLSAGVRLGARPDGSIDPGDAWVLRRGLSVAWVGWQWDVERRPGVVGVDVPQAVSANGEPIRSSARLEFLPLVAQPDRRLADEVGPWMGQFQALRADDLDEPGATLTVRDWFNGPRRVVDRSRWCFARDVGGSPVPDGEHVWLDGGFEARRYYEVIYTTSRCPIAGVGLAAVRDVVSFLRRDQGFDRVLSFGSSQSGRWLRQFIFDTANTAEDGSRVLDGVLCHIAGGRRGEFNNRSAQPSTMNALGFTHLPPFSPEDGLFAGARERGNAPLTIFANSATEYWRGDASLVHTDASGADLPDGRDWRAYLYAGSHHAAGMPDDFSAQLPVQLGPNRVEVLWASRAHLVALDEWVVSGTVPPPSEVPRLADGSGLFRAEALLQLGSLGRLAGVTLPGPDALLDMPPLDLGPDATAGIVRFPPLVTGAARPSLVAAVDDDGNEACGVRLPDVAVPLGVWFGWNPETPRARPAGSGGAAAAPFPVELWNLLGGGVDFPADEILERYGDHGRYLQQVEACVVDLVARRHLLQEDAPRLLDRARRRWDETLGSGVDGP